MRQTTAIEWWESVKGKTAFKIARNALDDVKGTPEHRALLLHHIVVACYHASHYNDKTDPHAQRRQTLRHSRAQAEKLAQAARLLKLACRRNDPAIEWADTLASANSGVRLTRTVKEGPAPWVKVAADYFAALESALRGKLPEIDGGPFMHRVCAGNLLFPKAVEPGRGGDVDATTMLCFELVFWMRVHENGWDWARQEGCPMPAARSSHYRVVAEWVNAALPSGGVGVSDATVRDRVRKLPDGVGLVDWPSAGKLTEK